MKLDINKEMADLLSNNKRAQDEPEYKTGYVDGVLDFYNIMKALLPKIIKKEKKR